MVKQLRLIIAIWAAFAALSIFGHAATLDGAPPLIGSSSAEIHNDDLLEKAELYKRANLRSVTITNPVSVNAIVATSANVPVTVLSNGLELPFIAGATNTGAVTIALDGTTATALVDSAGAALSANAIVSGGQYKARYISALSQWRLLGTDSAHLGYNCPIIPGLTAGGVTDNAAAINAVLTAAGGSSVCLGFPAGVFAINSSLSYSLSSGINSVSVYGAGSDTTTLLWPNASGGMTLNFVSTHNSAHFHNLTLATKQAGGQNAVTFTQSSGLGSFNNSEFDNVTFRGDDFGTAHYWSAGVNTGGVSGINFEGDTFYGQGVGATAQGTGINCVGPGGSTGYSIYINVSKSIFNTLSSGFTYGSYCQGATISQSNFQNGTTGIYAAPSETGVLSQLNITDDQFADSGNQISLQSNIGNVTIRGNDMFCPASNSCIYITVGTLGTIIGNGINCLSTTGTYGVALTADHYVVNGNTINACGTGIDLFAGSSAIRAEGNLLTGNTTDIVDSGTGDFVPTGTGREVLSIAPSLTLPNATGLPLSTGVTGTLQAAQFPALTGDCTTSAGSLSTTCTKINGKAVREVLTANRAYFFRSDGSDSNTGLNNTAGGAFLTANKAMSVIASTLDVAGYTVTIQRGNAVSYTSNIALTSWVGGGQIILDGNSQSFNVTSADCIDISGTLTGSITLQNATLATTTSGVVISHSAVGGLVIGSGITFAASAGSQIQVTSRGGFITIANNYTISGGSTFHFVALHGGFIQMNSRTVTLTGTPAFSGQFAYVSSGGELEAISDTFTGSATGTRYNVTNMGYINTGGGGISYLPGNAAGSGTNPSASPYGLYQ